MIFSASYRTKNTNRTNTIFGSKFFFKLLKHSNTFIFSFHILVPFI